MIVITQLYDENPVAYEVPAQSVGAFLELAESSGLGLVAVTESAILETSARPYWDMSFNSLTLHLCNGLVSVDDWKLRKLSPGAVELMVEMCDTRLKRRGECLKTEIADAEALTEWVRERSPRVDAAR